VNPRRILIASNNPGKLIEIRAILASLPITLLLPSQIGLQLDVEETGSSYAENAALKAVAFSRASGLLAMGDDSGLEVDALGGLPGIRSARFAETLGTTDTDRRAYLLQRLLGKQRPWRASFHCTIALSTPQGELEFAEGECLGEIIPEERGHNGFGYDPIFLLPELGLTMAELAMEVKNRLSHRARALVAAIPLLTKMINL
jgi:XTP/dITP diphosphohydrolase